MIFNFSVCLLFSYFIEVFSMHTTWPISNCYSDDNEFVLLIIVA